MSQSNSTSGGVGVGGLLLVAFVVLKLCKVIDWSWWWVTAPAWGPSHWCWLSVPIGGAIYLIALAGIELTKKVRRR